MATNTNVCSYALLEGAKKKSVDKLIELAINSLKTMREKVQVAAIAVLQHAEKHGDYSKAQVLVDGLGNGINKASLQKFFVDLGGLKLDADSGNFNGWQGAEYIKENFTLAKSTAWWSLKKAPDYKGCDLVVSLGKLVKTAEAALKKLEEVGIEHGTDSEEYITMLSVTNVDPDMIKLINQVKGGVPLTLVKDRVEEEKKAA